MKFTFAQDWHDYKVGDRVPASVNKSYLLRHGIIKRYSHVEALQAQQVEEVLDVEEVTEEVTVTEEAEEVPLEEVEELPLEEEATSEENAVVDDEVLEEATEDALALEEEAVEPTLDTPTIDETPTPQAKGKKK